MLQIIISEKEAGFWFISLTRCELDHVAIEMRHINSFTHEPLWVVTYTVLCEALFEALWCYVRPYDAVWGLVMLCEALWCASWYSVMPWDTTVTSWDVLWHHVFLCYALQCLITRFSAQYLPIHYATADRIITGLLRVCVGCAVWCVIYHKFHAAITLFLNSA